MIKQLCERNYEWDTMIPCKIKDESYALCLTNWCVYKLAITGGAGMY